MNLENDGKNWTWEETLLAFDLYSKIEYSKISASNKAVIYLAELLGRRPGAVAKNSSTLLHTIQSKLNEASRPFLTPVNLIVRFGRNLRLILKRWFMMP